MAKLNYKKYEKNIIKNKDSEKNCTWMLEEIETSVCELAYTETAYELVGLAFDEKMMEDDELIRMNQRVLQLAKEILSDTKTDIYEQALEIRSELKAHMDCLMAYMDRFSIYSYVLQSMLYYYEELPEASDYKDEDFTEEVVQELMHQKDPSVVKLIVMDILKSLPVRMTKVKFYEHVSDGLSVYIGSDQTALEDFLYQLKSAAGIYTPDGLKTFFPEIWSYYREFEAYDYKAMSPDDYAKARMTMGECLDYISRMMDSYNSLATIVNELTVLAKHGKNSRGISIPTAREIIQTVLEEYHAEDVVDLIEPLTPQLVALEGVQEPLSEELYEMSASLDTVRNSDWFEKQMSVQQKEQLQALVNACELLSSNNYSQLDRTNRDIEATREEVAKQFVTLQQEMEQIFDGKPKAVVRAIMASVLGYLPSHFSNLKQLQTHICSSLSGCSRIEEKMAHVDQIRSILYDYEFMDEDSDAEDEEEEWEEEEELTDNI